MLRQVLSSPQLRKVIVSQRITKEYLLANNFCSADCIEEVIGCVTLDNSSRVDKQVKRYFGKDKSTKDVCFVAHKDHPQGLDKGYNVFVQVAKELSKRQSDVYFHVVD